MSQLRSGKIIWEMLFKQRECSNCSSTMDKVVAEEGKLFKYRFDVETGANISVEIRQLGRWGRFGATV